MANCSENVAINTLIVGSVRAKCKTGRKEQKSQCRRKIVFSSSMSKLFISKLLLQQCFTLYVSSIYMTFNSYYNKLCL